MKYFVVVSSSKAKSSIINPSLYTVSLPVSYDLFAFNISLKDSAENGICLNGFFTVASVVNSIALPPNAVPIVNTNSSPLNPSLVSIVNFSMSFNAFLDFTKRVINSSEILNDALSSSGVLIWFISVSSMAPALARLNRIS